MSDDLRKLPATFERRLKDLARAEKDGKRYHDELFSKIERIDTEKVFPNGYISLPLNEEIKEILKGRGRSYSVSKSHILQAIHCGAEFWLRPFEIQIGGYATKNVGEKEDRKRVVDALKEHFEWAGFGSCEGGESIDFFDTLRTAAQLHTFLKNNLEQNPESEKFIKLFDQKQPGAKFFEKCQEISSKRDSLITDIADQMKISEFDARARVDQQVRKYDRNLF